MTSSRNCFRRARLELVAIAAVLLLQPADAIAVPPAGFRFFDIFSTDVDLNGFGGADVMWTSGDGKVLYALEVVGDDRVAVSFNLQTGKIAPTRLKPPRDKKVFIDMASVANDGLRVTGWSTAEFRLPAKERSCYVVQWNVKSGSVAREVRLPQDDTDGYWVQDVDGEGRQVLLERRSEKEIRFRTWDIVSKARSEELVVPLETRVLEETHSAFSPDGKTIAIQSLDAVLLIDSATMKEKHKLQLPSKRAEVLKKPRFSRDGKLVAVLSNDGGDQIGIWDANTGERLSLIAARPYPKEKKHPLIEMHDRSKETRAKFAPRGQEARDKEAERLKEDEKIARRRSAKHAEQLALGPFANDGTDLIVGRSGEAILVDARTAEIKQTYEIGRFLNEAADAALARSLGQPVAPGTETVLYQDWLFEEVLFGQNERTLIFADTTLSPVAILPFVPNGATPGKKPRAK